MTHLNTKKSLEPRKRNSLVTEALTCDVSLTGAIVQYLLSHRFFRTVGALQSELTGTTDSPSPSPNNDTTTSSKDNNKPQNSIHSPRNNTNNLDTPRSSATKKSKDKQQQITSIDTDSNNNVIDTSSSTNFVEVEDEEQPLLKAWLLYLEQLHLKQASMAFFKNNSSMNFSSSNLDKPILFIEDTFSTESISDLSISPSRSRANLIYKNKINKNDVDDDDDDDEAVVVEDDSDGNNDDDNTDSESDEIDLLLSSRDYLPSPESTTQPTDSSSSTSSTTKKNKTSYTMISRLHKSSNAIRTSKKRKSMSILRGGGFKKPSSAKDFFAPSPNRHSVGAVPLGSGKVNDDDDIINRDTLLSTNKSTTSNTIPQVLSDLDDNDYIVDDEILTTNSSREAYNRSYIDSSARSSTTCDRFVPHTWRRWRCRDCGKPKDSHLFESTSIPSSPLTHSPSNSTTTTTASSPSSSVNSTPVSIKSRLKKMTSGSSPTAPSSPSSGSTSPIQCTTFVRHQWRPNQCRDCGMNLSAHTQ